MVVGVRRLLQIPPDKVGSNLAETPRRVVIWGLAVPVSRQGLDAVAFSSRQRATAAKDRNFFHRRLGFPREVGNLFPCS